MHGIKRNRAGVLLCLVVLALAQTGCSLFAGSASMRIEVEVYKGPLSKEPELQLAELFGQVQESVDAMNGGKEIMVLIAQDIGLIKKEATNFTKCEAPSWFDLTTNAAAAYYCMFFGRLYDDATIMEDRLQLINEKLG